MTTTIPAPASENTGKRPLFTGPVLASLAESYGPGTAQLDARWAARVLAGWTVAGYEGTDESAERAVRVAALRDLLEACGLTPAAPRWAGAAGGAR